MKKVKPTTSTPTDFEKLQTLLEKKFTSLESQIKNVQQNQNGLEYNQKILQQSQKGFQDNQKASNQKIDDSFKELNVRIFKESARTREELMRSFRAEIQVRNDELQTEISTKLDKVYKSLFERISFVADLVTIELGDKIQKHDKRIKKLEQITPAA